MKTRQNLTAIITDRNGNVLSIGKNSYVKTHPLQARHAAMMGVPDKIHLHAEIHAITLCKNLDKAYKISVFRYNSKGKTLLAKPCSICQSAIRSTGIKIVEYTS